jgi:alpha-glucosidase
VPESVLPRPSANGNSSASTAEIQFSYVANPFSFAIIRKSSNETLFDTSAANIIFQSQYVRLRTKLPNNPHLYGLGEHTDPFQLNSTNYTRTLWSRDAYLVPSGTNLYGNHPVYFDHRGSSGTHGVFLLSSSGMDIKINKTDTDGQYLEYNTLGGVIDLYFLAGPTPKDVSRQYAATVGLPVMQPYWGLGFHQCKYGYKDVYEVAEVVANYSAAGIPLETMWTDIDYMNLRKVFTLDPERFPLDKMRELVSTLHDRQQHYVVMVDPAVAYLNNSAYDNGKALDVFLKYPNGTIFNGVVWPGITVFPDWFHPNTQSYWNQEFITFFDANSGVDIDALW